jgi:ketosteroid isomerase-like protein
MRNAANPLPGDPAMAHEPDRAGLDLHGRLYTESLEAGDLDAWLDTLTDDCLFLPPNAPAVIGKDAVRQWAKESFFDPFDIGFRFGYEDHEMLGDRAVAWGWYDQTLEPKAGGDGIHLKGKFIDVFKKAPDGSWKLAWCCFNADDS